MKSYKTKEELLNHLKVDRHLELEEPLIPVFDMYRYGQVIDAYKGILASNILDGGKVHIYDKEITLKSFINMMNIDEYFSIKLIAYISHYEKVLKKYISDKVCESMFLRGDINCCDYSLFDSIKKNSVDTVLNCFVPLDKQYNKDGLLALRSQDTFESRMRTIDKIIDFSNGKNKSELNYYCSNYYNSKGTIPFYILVGTLSIGNLIVLFEMLTDNLQNDFIKTILKKDCINKGDIITISNKHSVIRKIRNIIHHHEPLIPYLCKNECFGFEVKKSAIKLLKKNYENCEYSSFLEIKIILDFEIVKKLKSKSAKKLLAFINLLK